jgi:cell division protein FtsL
MGGGANILTSFGGAFVIFIIVAVAVMIALRIMLPFSIFKIKELAEQSLEEQKKSNELLSSLLTKLSEQEKRGETDGRDRKEGPLD